MFFCFLMTYQSNHVLILSPKEWYTAVADIYKNYHDHLDSFLREQIFSPFTREKKTIDILDLGAGDGRLYKQLSLIPHKRYVACDTVKELLDHHPGKEVEKVVCDLEEALPFADESFDLITSFFVFEHINDIDTLFEELYRIMKPGWTLIIWHFLQRREFIWKIWKKQFKIQQYNHTLKAFESAANNAFFAIHIRNIYEKDTLVGYIISCQK